MRRWFLILPVLLAGGPWLAGTLGDETLPPSGDPARGRRLLLEKPYLPSAFDQALFDEIWQVWPEPLRTRAEEASASDRRRMAYDRYGLSERPGDPSGRPLQYVVDEGNNWSMSCLACHAGEVRGEPRIGLPNTHIAMQTLAEDIVATKRRLGIPLKPPEYLLPVFPLGTTNGTTNAVMFSISLLTFRDADLEVASPARLWKMVHHDLDAPPWWHFKKKTHLYIDGFAPKSHRALVQFALVPQNDGATIRGWEQDFRDIRAYLETLEPPPWPFEVDADLAAEGRGVFENACSKCHGTYGDVETYPNRYVPIDVVGTDPVRLRATSPEMRRRYASSWLTDYDPTGVVIDTKGYVAPPLDGIWASAPYFHNGSVPTLWHVLHPDERPVVWKRSRDGYDEERVGLEVEVFDDVPAEAREDRQERRSYFDTRAPGKSAAGHLFPKLLDETERQALLEYLKTL